MIPIWLYLLSILYLGMGFFASGFVLYDIIKNKKRQKMKIMNIVWPITTWYLGPIGIFAYKRIGKLSYQDKSDDNENIQNNTNFQKKRWNKAFLQQIFTASTHCGAGCTLGDVISEWLIFIIALSILGSTLLASYTIDFIFAYGLGIIFHYCSYDQKKERRKNYCKRGIKRCNKGR